MKIKSHKAYNLNDALELLEQYKESAKIIAGGTDIVIELKNKEISPEAMIDISDVKEIREIREEGGCYRIGAGVRFTEIVKSGKFDERMKGFVDAAHSVGSPQIRSTGTVGGNICHGSPAADSVPPLLALDATAVIVSKNGEREIPLREMFLDKGKVDLKAGEMLKEVVVKKPQKGEVVTFSKLGLRKALAISRICTSVYLKLEDSKIVEARIGNGALGRYGMREDAVEEKLKGKQLNEETIESSVSVMEEEIKERLKGRSSVEFKGEAIKGIYRDALTQAIDFLK
jgi:CO/xanthine dehydrogenase FAD-binding subunit